MLNPPQKTKKTAAIINEKQITSNPKNDDPASGKENTHHSYTGQKKLLEKEVRAPQPRPGPPGGT